MLTTSIGQTLLDSSAMTTHPVKPHGAKTTWLHTIRQVARPILALPPTPLLRRKNEPHKPDTQGGDGVGAHRSFSVGSQSEREERLDGHQRGDLHSPS